ncbi:MAG TPA: hypothetical protein DDZ53_09720 [Firmicutes bacterium]|nr:hypothetical protein [Bacillota bacterium]
MPEICPVCNGLSPFVSVCIHCQNSLEDYGQLQSFLDPYAPFEEDELVLHSEISPYEGFCQHLAYCSNCGRPAKVKVALIPGPAIFT